MAVLKTNASDDEISQCRDELLAAEKSARESQAAADLIDAATFDLKAVNPRARVERDLRTAGNLDMIAAHRRTVEAALASLRLTWKKAEGDSASVSQWRKKSSGPNGRHAALRAAAGARRQVQILGRDHSARQRFHSIRRLRQCRRSAWVNSARTSWPACGSTPVVLTRQAFEGAVGMAAFLRLQPGVRVARAESARATCRHTDQPGSPCQRVAPLHAPEAPASRS